MYPEYAEEIDPLRLAAWIEAYNAGVTALQANEVEKALQSLELANSLYRKRPEAMVTLGSLYVQQGDFAKGETVFREALALLRGPGRAALNEQQAASWAEDELTISLRLSNIYADQEKFAEAEQVYRDLLESQPDNGMARANLAVVMARAGKTDEAAVVYRELLAEEELTEATLFNIGIGLFRAQDFEQAARAFTRSLELNPVSHETLYNLGQSLYARAVKLERESEAAAAPRKQEIQTELTRLYSELRSRTEELLVLDPTNRNAMMLLAQSQRSLAELDSGNSDALRRSALATLEAHEGTTFEITNIRIVPAEGSVQILGRVTNLKAAEGSTISFRFSAIDRAGTEIAGEDITVTAPAVGAGTNFDTRLTVPEGAAGWKYVVRG
jgi:tetratricopeptide (TPR) repeat protein